jgi:hypothetical protein
MAGVSLGRKRFGDTYRSLAHGTLENRRNEVANRANEESMPATCALRIHLCTRIYPIRALPRCKANNSECRLSGLMAIEI